MTGRVAIILVNWNGQRHTLECLASLREDTYADKYTIVVDNGSSDDSVAVIRSRFPDVLVLEAGENLGFTGGNNLGMRRALEDGVDYLYILNNDTVVEPDALSALVQAAEFCSDYAIFTPVIHYYDDRSQTWLAGTNMDMMRGSAVHDNSRIPARDEPMREIPWASGCALLIRASVLQQVGCFDVRYFYLWEDVDLCLRVRAAGHKIGIVPAARIYHKVSQTFQAASSIYWYYQIRNNLLCARLHSGPAYRRAVRVMLRQYFKDCRYYMQGRIKGANPLPPTLRAIRDHFTQRYGMRHTRR